MSVPQMGAHSDEWWCHTRTFCVESVTMDPTRPVMRSVTCLESWPKHGQPSTAMRRSPTEIFPHCDAGRPGSSLHPRCSTSKRRKWCTHWRVSEQSLSKEEQAREDGPEDGVRLIRMQHTEPQPNARDIVRCMWTVCVRVSSDAPGACQGRVMGAIAAFPQFRRHDPRTVRQAPTCGG